MDDDRIPTFRDPRRPTIEDTDKRKEAKAFYSSPRWRKLRAMKIRRSPLCECKADGSCKMLATEVHHVIDRVERPDLAFVMDNLQAMAKPCHSRVTRERILAKSKRSTDR